MTAQEWYQKRKGQSLLVPGVPEADRGQCVQAADYALNEIYNLPYIYGNNAIDWWNNFDNIPQLKNNFVKVSDGSVKQGSFVIFNEKTGSPFGHIDIALIDASTSSFRGADSNWGGDKTLHEVTHEGAQYVIGSLRHKGEDMVPVLFRDDVIALWSRFVRQDITEEDIAFGVGKTWEEYMKILLGYEFCSIQRSDVDAIWGKWMTIKPGEQDYVYAQGKNYGKYIYDVMNNPNAISVGDTYEPITEQQFRKVKK